MATRQAGSPERSYAFVGGCPRSGTSAVTLLLNEHPQVALGFERYKRARDIIEPYHFEPEVMCNPVPAETDIFVPGFYRYLADKFARGTVTVVGDKVPMYTEMLDRLHATFPACRVVLTVRELEPTAASFSARATDPQDVWSEANDHRVAASFWNDALAAARAFEIDGHGDRLLVIPAEELFGGRQRWLDMLLEFLELPTVPGIVRAYKEMVRAAGARSEAVVRKLPWALTDAVVSSRDQELDNWWRRRVERQVRDFRGRSPTSPAEPITEMKPVSMPSEIREELFEALKARPRQPEEVTELEQRVDTQAKELHDRGQRLVSLEQDLQDARTEVSDERAQRAELERRLALRGEELEIAVRQLASIEKTVVSLEQIVEVLRSDRSDLSARVDALTVHNDGLIQTLSERDSIDAQRRSQIAELEQATRVQEARITSLQAELARAREVLAVLEGERDRTLDDVRRAAASRAWRWGHGVTRMLRTLTFRRSVRRAGALEAIVARLESTRRALPAAGETGAAQTQSGEPEAEQPSER